MYLEEKKGNDSVKSFVSSISRLFHHLTNANQKEALLLKSCTEVKTERKYLPKVSKKKRKSMDCAAGFKLMQNLYWTL